MHQHSMTLYQALGPAQLAALVRTRWRCIEPGPGGGRFIYLKCNQRYAEMIARQRYRDQSGAGFVVSLQLPSRTMARFSLETIAYEEHLEYRVPVQALAMLQGALLEPIQLVSVFRVHESYSVPAGRTPPRALLAV